jgi:hypothetical protein
MVSHCTVRSNIRTHATGPHQYDCHSLLPPSSFQLLERYDEMDGLYRQCTTFPASPVATATGYRTHLDRRERLIQEPNGLGDMY